MYCLPGPVSQRKMVKLTQISRSRLGGVVARVMGDRLLETELIDDSLTLVLDIKEPHTRISCETDKCQSS